MKSRRERVKDDAKNYGDEAHTIEEAGRGLRTPYRRRAATIMSRTAGCGAPGHALDRRITKTGSGSSGVRTLSVNYVVAIDSTGRAFMCRFRHSGQG